MAPDEEAITTPSTSISAKIQDIYQKNRPRGWFTSNSAKKKKDDDFSLAPHQLLVTSPEVLNRSMIAVRFAVFSDCVNGMILQPNYAIMVSPDAHEESFPSTAPFDFSSATYFIPMTAMLGMAVASAVTGRLSDKIGRKPVILFCLIGSMIGSAVKFFLRGSFWGFCIANFCNGLLSGSLPVALAYVGDVFVSNARKSKEFGTIVGFWVLGQSVGGMIAILMSEQGLFAPLWVGVAIMAIASTTTFFFLIEAGQIQIDKALLGDDDGDDEDEDAPTELDKRTMTHILVGAFTDTVGSKALFPICLSPLAFNQFYQDFVDRDEDPIMPLNTYKWLSVLVALMVIPSTLMTPKVFDKIGLAGGCVAGNFFTGVLTIILLVLGSVEPPTSALFGGFVAFMYVGYPFTVMSQLSTSPMLDLIAPVDQRGNVQGTYTTFLNIGNATAPWLLGLLADGAGTSTAIWTGIGISFLAAIINFPLILKKGFGPSAKKKKQDDDDTTLASIDEEEVIAKLQKGEYVSAKVRDYLNRKRMERSEAFLVPHAGTFAKDEANLHVLKNEAKEDFTFLRSRARKVLASLHDAEAAKKLPYQLEDFNASYSQIDPKELDEINKELGAWFADYLAYGGYKTVLSPVVIKMILLQAFPPVSPGNNEELTLENFEEIFLTNERLYNRFLHTHDEEAKSGWRLRDLFGTGHLRKFWG